MAELGPETSVTDLIGKDFGPYTLVQRLGVGWRQGPWKDIEITGGGAPRVRLSGKAALRAESIGVSKVLVTITHTDNQALVMALSMGDGG